MAGFARGRKQSRQGTLILWRLQKNEGVACMRIEIFCPVCAAAGIRRKLMEVDPRASGIIYPYCKGCKKNIKIELRPQKAG